MGVYICTRDTRSSLSPPPAHTLPSVWLGSKEHGLQRSLPTQDEPHAQMFPDRPAQTRPEPDALGQLSLFPVPVQQLPGQVVRTRITTERHTVC